MKFRLTADIIDEVVAMTCAPCSNEALTLSSFLNNLEDEDDPEEEEALGFDTVDTVEKCLTWLRD